MLRTDNLNAIFLGQKGAALRPPSAPAPNPTELIGWYDAAVGVSVVGSDSVSSWANRAIGMSAAVQATDAIRPAFVNDANGARIRYNGASGYRNLMATFNNYSVDKTMYVVAATDAAVTNGTFLELNEDDSGTTPNRGALIIYDALNTVKHRVVTPEGVTANDVTFNVPDQTKERIYWLGKTSTQMRPTNQGIANYLSGGSNNSVAKRLSIGSLVVNNATWTHKGHIREVLIYNVLLSDAQHQEAINYLTAKYRLWTVQNNSAVGLLGRPALALDTFDGAAGSLIDENRIMNNGLRWLAGYNTQWELDGNGSARVVSNTTDPTFNNVVYCPATQANAIISVRVDMSGTYNDMDFGITFNCADRNNNWRALIHQGATTARISVRSSSLGIDYRQIQHPLFEPYTSNDVFSVMTQGDSILLLKNGVANSAIYTEGDRPLKGNAQHGMASNLNAQTQVSPTPPPPQPSIPKAGSAYEFSIEML